MPVINYVSANPSHKVEKAESTVNKHASSILHL